MKFVLKGKKGTIRSFLVNREDLQNEKNTTSWKCGERERERQRQRENGGNLRRNISFDDHGEFSKLISLLVRVPMLRKNSQLLLISLLLPVLDSTNDDVRADLFHTRSTVCR